MEGSCLKLGVSSIPMGNEEKQLLAFLEDGVLSEHSKTHKSQLVVRVLKRMMGIFLFLYSLQC